MVLGTSIQHAMLVFSVMAASAQELCLGDCDIVQESSVLLLQTGFSLHGVLDPTGANTSDVNATKRVIPHDAAELTGVSTDSVKNLDTFISGLSTNILTVMFCIGVFMVLRRRYPLMYSNNVLIGCAPCKPEDTYFSWFGASVSTSIDEATECIGLDNALQLEFCHLGMQIMRSLVVPLLLILAPLHYLYGGGGNETTSSLSRIAMNNVIDGHTWLYYVHAATVFYVCLVVQGALYNAQSRFVERRFHWLKKQPLPRATTVLVEGIPRAFRSDEKVREFFSQVFSGNKVKEVHVVKHTQVLEALVAASEQATENRRKAELEWDKAGKAPEKRPKVLPLAVAPGAQLAQFQDLSSIRSMGSHLFSGPVDAIDFYTEQLDKLREQIQAERASVKERSLVPGGINSSSAFVTFVGRREAEMAKNIMYTSDGNEWVVSVPPEPSSIRWDDLRQDTRLELLYAIIGYAALVGLYFGFMPICVGITNISYAINMGPLQSMWASLAPTMGLTVFLSFLPTVMLILFRNLFALKSDPWAQQKLQVWYFWFQVVFVILVTAVGSDVVTFAQGVAASPFSIFGLLADQLPKATDFYLNYLVLQCSTHAMAMMRYVPLGKYFAFKALWTEEEARQKAEPEDQDYYGIGSRTARLAILLLVGIIYSTLSPLISLVALGTLALYRVVYGYLIVFAETKKPDVGGAFWSTMLDHVHAGNIIYCVLMTGVLAKRAPNQIPMIIAAASLVYTVWSYNYYQSAFNWQKLAFNEIVLNSDDLSVLDTEERYIQPVLVDEKDVEQ